MSFIIHTAVPVIRMLDEQPMLDFYLDYLGFALDWQHRASDDPDSPLYAQVRHGDAALHLNGHADASAPPSEVRFPVDDLDAYCAHLRAKDAVFEKPEIVDPREEGRLTDMNIIDPSGNHLVFWSPSDAAKNPW